MTSADKRAFWRRAEAARQARLISYGAFAYLGTLARLASARGDGVSFVLGERVIEDVTGTNRASARRWRAQLTAAGLIGFQRKWAYKKGWFWEAKTSLFFDSTGLKMSPEASGLKMSPVSGLKMSPSLNGSPNHQNGTDGEHGSSLRSTERSVEKGSSLRSTERLAATAPKQASGNAPVNGKDTNHPRGASKAGQGALSVGSTPPPPAKGHPPKTDDGKGPDPERRIPDDEAARRIREIAAKLRFRA